MHSAVAKNPSALVSKLSAGIGEAIRKKDWSRATVEADRLMAAAPGRPETALRALQVFLQSGEVDRAAAVARAARGQWQASPKVAHLAMLALGRAGDRVAAAEAGRLALRDTPENLRLAAAVADALIQAGCPAEAFGLLTAAGVRESEEPRAWYELARAGWAARHPGASVLADAQRALALAPGNLRATELVARLLLDTGQPDTALALLQPLEDGHRNSTVRMLHVEAALGAGRLDEALLLAMSLAESTVDSLPMTRRLTGLLSAAGLQTEARGIYSRSLDQRRARLPARFADGVARILCADSPPGPKIPLQRIGWLWAQLALAGHAPSDRAVWERELRQVTALDRLILDWIECRPKALAETTAIMDGIAPATETLAAAQAEGRGVFVAAAHVGLLFGSLAALAGTGLPMTFVASVPNLGLAKHDAHLISTSGQDEGAVGRALYRAVRSGQIVSVAIEGGAGQGQSRYPLLDRLIPLSTFIPRLAWKTRTPSFFPLMVWTGSRAKVSLARLPDPDRYHSAEAYVTGWTRAYLKHLELAILDNPASARAAGGFWTSITF